MAAVAPGGERTMPKMIPVGRIGDIADGQSRTIAGMWSEGKGANDDTGTRLNSNSGYS